jgi:hypothetical protein
MRRSNKFASYFTLLIICLLILIPISNAQEKISPEDALKYVGQSKAVCGVVASTFYAYASTGEPTYLNLNKPYPNQIFVIVIWGSDRDKFKNRPEVLFKGKRVCVTGLIEDNRGLPQIVVRDPSQIRIELWKKGTGSAGKVPGQVLKYQKR